MSTTTSSAPPVETDPRCPSGQWRGYWDQSLVRGWMDLHLKFAAGKVRGWGRDAIGDFVVNGSYDLATGRITLEKLIINRHVVNYHGTLRAGFMAGRWSIPNDDSGAFRLWPKSLGERGPLEAQQEELWPEEQSRSAAGGRDAR